MADGFRRFRANFTCQASAAITADAFSGGTQTAFDTTASGNLDGAFSAEVEVDVTAWTADARCEVYQEAEQHDGTGYNAPRLIGSTSITAVDKYMIPVFDLSEAGTILIKAVDVGFTASASMRGIYPADA